MARPGVRDSLRPFSIAVWGRGRLLTWVVADGCQRFPNATWYDRSEQVQAFVKREVQLGRSGYLDEEGTRLAERAAANLRKPKRADVDIHFLSNAHRGLVRVAGRRGERSVSYRYDARTLDDYQRHVDRILDTVLRVR